MSVFVRRTITFIIGNGFDLQLGLATRYDQFLEWYIKQSSEDKDIAEFKTFLKENEHSEWWTDAELAMGKYISEFLPIDKYYKLIRDFKIKLVEYLKIQDAKFVVSDDRTIGNIFVRFLNDFSKEILLPRQTTDIFTPHQHIAYNFITFNYTSALSRILEATKTVCNDPENLKYQTVSFDSCVAIHNSLDSQIIMGVNDETQLDIAPENLDEKLIRTMIKPETNRALGRGEDFKVTYLIENSNIIVIYGWSMGPTDDKWRSEISAWLEKQDHYIVVFRNEKMQGVNTAIAEDILDFVLREKDRFIDNLYSFSIDDSKRIELRNKISIIDKTDLLNFNIVNDDNSK